MNDCRTCPRRAGNDEAVPGPCCDDPAVIAEEAAADARAAEYLNGCPAEVWDGPYLMRCAMGETICATHGPFERAKRCAAESGCRRPTGHGGRCGKY